MTLSSLNLSPMPCVDLVYRDSNALVGALHRDAQMLRQLYASNMAAAVGAGPIENSEPATALMNGGDNPPRPLVQSIPFRSLPHMLFSVFRVYRRLSILWPHQLHLLSLNSWLMLSRKAFT